MGERLRRAVARQWPPFVLFATLIGVVSAAFFHYVAEHTMGFAAFQGAVIGAGASTIFVLIREVGRNTITTLSSLDKHRGYTVLGAAPELTAQTLRELPPDQRSPLGALAYLPASPFATAFRDLQGQIADGSVVALLSSTSGEGSTTASVCAAASATQQGRSAIVLDCDVRRRSMTRAFDVESHAGLMDACAEPDRWKELVQREAETGTHFMSIGRVANAWQSLSDRPGLLRVLEHLREEYDCVLMDCPPAFTADGIGLTRLADRAIVIAAWDQTPIDAIRQTMRQLQSVNNATAIFVNRVPPDYRFGRLRPD